MSQRSPPSSAPSDSAGQLSQRSPHSPTQVATTHHRSPLCLTHHFPSLNQPSSTCTNYHSLTHSLTRPSSPVTPLEKRFFVVRSEDLWEEPRMFTERLYHWVVGDDTLALKDGSSHKHHNHSASSPAPIISLQLPPLLDRFLRLSIDRGDAQFRSSFRSKGTHRDKHRHRHMCTRCRVDTHICRLYVTTHSLTHSRPLQRSNPQRSTHARHLPGGI